MASWTDRCVRVIAVEGDGQGVGSEPFYTLDDSPLARKVAGVVTTEAMDIRIRTEGAVLGMAWPASGPGPRHGCRTDPVRRTSSGGGQPGLRPSPNRRQDLKASGYEPALWAAASRLRAYLAVTSASDHAEAVPVLATYRERGHPHRVGTSFLVPSRTDWVD
jgi:hypothetical protein